MIKNTETNNDRELLRHCSLRVLELANNSVELYGLLSGLSGAVLSLAYLSKHSDIISNDDISLLIDRAATYLKNPTSDTICDGTTGVCWLLRLLAKEGIVDVDDIDEVLEDIDKLNVAFLGRELEIGNIDYLHGAIGMAHYLLYFGIEKESVAEAVVRTLKASAEEDSSGRIRWKKATYTGGSERENVYNLGLSHGMAAIVYLLAEIYETTNNEEALRLLKGSVKYFSEIFDKNSMLPYSFPSWIPIEPVDPSKIRPGGRLAWCYGDVGVSFGLLKAARVLKDDSLYAMAIKTLEKTLDYGTPIMDWCFCHGAAGLYYMYKKVYSYTGLPRFEAAAKACKKRLYEMQADILQSDSLGVLQGIPGVILSLLDRDNQTPDSWDAVILLNAI